MTKLFKGDAYIIITGAATVDLSKKNTTYDRRLNIDFNFKQDVSSSPNTGQITVYNLAEETRKALETKDLTLELYAGYEDIKLIGKGDIKDIVHSRVGPDWLSTFTVGDGKKSYDESKTVNSFIEGTPKKDIIDTISGTFNLDIRDITKDIKGEIVGGMSLLGRSKDIMNQLAPQFGFDWSIQDDELLLTDKGESDDLEVIVISSRTGLLESPRYTAHGTDIIIQLNPDVRPKRLVEVKSITKAYSGLYIVESTEFLGTNYDGNFSVKLSCRTV